MSTFHLVDHPLIQHKLTIMREKDTPTSEFKQLLDEISMLMGYEITRNLPTEDVEIETPICKTTQKKIAGKKLAIVHILRALCDLLQMHRADAGGTGVRVRGVQRDVQRAVP